MLIYAVIMVMMGVGGSGEVKVNVIVIAVRYFTCVFRYWHRSLNPKKLVECKFSNLSRNMTMSRSIKLYKLPDRVRFIFLRQHFQVSICF